jgi:hypothetical protein
MAKRNEYSESRSVRVYLYMQMAALLLCLLVSQSLFGNEEEPKHTSLFSQDWLKTLVSVEVKEPSKPGEPEKKPMPIGSAFLVLTPGQHMAMVTAKHVVFDKDKGWALRPNLAYRLNRTNGPSDLFLETLVAKYEPQGWFKSDRYDVACRMMVRRIEGSDFKWIKCAQFLTKPAIEPGAPLFIIGFPMGMRSEEYAMPILRGGMVARTDPGRILADAFVFPGNSGGPVVYAQASQIFSRSILGNQWLVGLVSGALTYEEKAISPQTQRTRITFEDNMGLCDVVPASAILELLDSPEFKAVDIKPKNTEAEQKNADTPTE